MVGSVFLVIVINACVFSSLFWVLTFLTKYLYSNKYENYKLNFYECGFKSLTKTKLSYSINYIMLILFLLIYDGEFLILIPFSLNLAAINFYLLVAFSFFLFWLILALIFDYAYSALDWQV